MSAEPLRRQHDEHPYALPTPEEAPVLPHNIPVEQTLIGAVLVHNAALEKLDGLVRPEHFHLPVHGRIWAAIEAAVAAGGIADPVTLQPQFAADAALADVGGGVRYLFGLAAQAVTATGVEHYGRLLVELARRRGLIGLADELRAEASAPDAESGAAALIERAAAELFRLGEDGRTGGGFVRMAAAGQRVLEASEAAAKRGGLIGLSTGIAAVDAILGGLVGPDMIVLAARPSMGKTSLAMEIARNVARAGRHVGVISLEMSAEQLVRRSLGAQAGVGYFEIARGAVSATEFAGVATAAQQLHRLPIDILDEPGIKVGRLRTLLRRLKAQHDTGLVVVDYLQLLRPDRERENQVAEVTQISAGLKGIAKELGVPLLALSQLSRRVEERPDKRPMLSDLRESGAIEQDADTVLFLYRQHYYDSRRQNDGEDAAARMARLSPIKHEAELIFAKNRHGPLGTAELWCDLATDRWRGRDTGAQHDPALNLEG